METMVINNSLTEIYATGGGWLTQSRPTNFHVFVRQKPLTKDESADDWREVTDKEKEALEKADAEWVRPSDALLNLWNKEAEHWEGLLGLKSRGLQMCYNESTGFFEYGGILDLSVFDAETIINVPVRGLYQNGLVQGLYAALARPRAFLPIYLGEYGGAFYMDKMFEACTNLETVIVADRYGLSSVHPIWARATADTFKRCTNLRFVNGYLGMNFDTSTTHFTNANCPKLERIYLAKVQKDIPTLFSASPFVEYDTFRFMVDNAANTSAITITVHADVYAKLQGEWSDIMTDAATKNITFATA